MFVTLLSRPLIPAPNPLSLATIWKEFVILMREGAITFLSGFGGVAAKTLPAMEKSGRASTDALPN